MEEEPYFSVKAIAHRLQVSEDTVRRWIRSGKLPAFELEGQYRIAPSDLQTFLNKRRKQPKPPKPTR